MSTKVSPEHYTLLLTAVTAPAIQLVVCPGITSPVAAPLPPPHQATTPMGRAAIIDATKLKVLPDPGAPCLRECNKNTATRVLAAAIYSKLERKFFNSTHSRMEVSTAFCCNVSQLTKALTGVEYHSGPHHYKPKPRSHARKPLTKVKHQMHHSLRRPGLHQARKLVRKPNHGRRSTP